MAVLNIRRGAPYAPHLFLIPIALGLSWPGTVGGTSPSQGGDNAAGSPPRSIPDALRDNFTLGGQIPVARYYVDDSNSGTGTHYQFPREDVDAMIKAVERAKTRAQWLIDARKSDKSTWIFEALNEHSLAGLRVVVFGSLEPYYEAICLSFGAATVTTVEYNKLTFEHPKLETLTVKALQENQFDLEGKFDVALSISSFDHDGLGRYGDPINPNGDLEAMEGVKRILSPEGVLLLSVPIGPDVLVWNLHRRYGKLRLPQLLQVHNSVGKLI